MNAIFNLATDMSLKYLEAHPQFVLHEFCSKLWGHFPEKDYSLLVYAGISI